jgi:hypothetical protein
MNINSPTRWNRRASGWAGIRGKTGLGATEN